MEAIRKTLKKELNNLDINEIEEITIKSVAKKFKQRALQVHPDKTGKEDDAEFKQLIADYRTVQTALKELKAEDESDENDENDDKCDIYKFFEKNNVANEKSKSWTIVIEKDKVEDWNSVLKWKCGEPKVVNDGTGHQFKAPVGEHNVSITLYKSPNDHAPKMSIQGSQDSLKEFVFNTMPELYYKVCENDKKAALIYCSDDPTHSCNVCGRVYKQKKSLKTHIEVKHTGITADPKEKAVRNKKHSQQTPFKHTCAVCEESFKLKTQLLVHNKNKHPLKKKKEMGQQKEKEKSSEIKTSEQTEKDIEVVDLENEGEKENNEDVVEILDDLVDKIQSTHQPTPHTNPPEKSEVGPTQDWLTATNEDLDNMLRKVNEEIDKVKFKCEVCDTELESTIEMEEHIGKVHIRVTCDFCSEEFSTMKHLELHKKEKHSNARTEPVQEIPTCDLCGIMLYSDQHITEHISSHGGNTSTQDKSAESEADGPYQCSECGKLFNSMIVTEEHIKITHSDQSKYVSTNVIFLKPTECKQCKIYQDEKYFIENEFEKLFRSHEKVKEMNEHLVVQNNERKMLFKENKELREAAKVNEDLANDLLKRNQILKEDLDTKNRIIEADKNLRKEVELHSQSEWMSKEVMQHNIPEFKCDQCEWKTHNKTYLIGHKTSHVSSQTLECTECEFKTQNKTTLERHIAAHKEMFKCTENVGNGDLICQKIFNTKNELKEHKEMTHKGTTQFKCNKCEKEFTYHNSLVQHAKTKHEDTGRLPVGHQTWARKQNANQQGNNVERFLCTECPAEFRSEQDLIFHTGTHKINIPCNHCDKMFETKQDQHHHNRTAHAGFTKVQKLCRHFLQGWCAKGQMCSFSHVLPQNQWPQKEQDQQQVPLCKRGPGCDFWRRGVCNFFHPIPRAQQNVRRQNQEIRRQNQEVRSHGQEFRRPGQEVRGREMMLCKFQERCWNPDTCEYKHLDFTKDREFLENY